MRISAVYLGAVTLLLLWTPVYSTTAPPTPAPTPPPTAAPTAAPVTCAPNTHGPPSCTPCGHCIEGTVCGPIDGVCPAGCQPGYQLPTCTAACQNSTYGKNCANKCSPLCKEQCNIVNGDCLNCQEGYLSPSCTACPNSTYGPNCANRCGHCLGGAVCSKTTGACEGGCEAGWNPPLCNTECLLGKYGINCSQTCGSCSYGQPCNRTTGSCLQCMDNYDLPLCKDCVAGQWGPNCGQRCGQCGEDRPCHRDTGVCLKVICLDGWIGPLCTEKCTRGFYGSNCSSTCGRCSGSANCRHDNGLCEEGCEDGYEGVLCDRGQVDLRGTIAGSVMGAAVLIAASIVGTLLFLHCRQGSSNFGGKGARRGQREDTSHGNDVSDDHRLPAIGGACAPNYDPIDPTRKDIHLYEKQLKSRDVLLPLGSSDVTANPGDITYQNVDLAGDRSPSNRTRNPGNKNVTGRVEAIYGNT